MEQGGGCCGGGDHQHHHDHDHEELDMMSDPTLMSCCERDEYDYKKAMELKRVLTDHDPSTQNVRMRQQVVLLPAESAEASAVTSKSIQAQTASAAAAIAQKLRELDIQSDSDDSDLDLDEDFADLFAARRQELAAQFEAAAKNASDGYGIILDTDFASLFKELKASPDVPRVVFVRSSRVESNAVHDMLKEMLVVANRFIGTKFYSIVTSSMDDENLRQLRLTTAPTVVAFRRGQRVDANTIQEKDLSTKASILWEARLLPWLTMCNVLETTRQDQGPVPLKRTTSIKRGEGGDNGEEVAYDCGVANCRIRYAYEHEHVGPSQESKAEISAWRSESS